MHQGRDPVAAWLAIGGLRDRERHHAALLPKPAQCHRPRRRQRRPPPSSWRAAQQLSSPRCSIDQSAFTLGKQAAQGIRAKTREMSEERGIDVGFLAAGAASWTEHAGEVSSGERFTEDFTAPVMLVPITLRPREDASGDFEHPVQRRGPAQPGPGSRHLATRHSTRLDLVEFHNTGYATARFDPNRPADAPAALPAACRTLTRSRSGASLTSPPSRTLHLPGDPSGLQLDHPVIHAMATGGTPGGPGGAGAAAAAPGGPAGTTRPAVRTARW